MKLSLVKLACTNKCEQRRTLYFLFLSDSADCACNTNGTLGGSRVCNNVTGQCLCKTNVTGRQCNICKDQFFNLQFSNPDGCSPCDCFLGGAIDNFCNTTTGRCNCRDGFTGRRCNELAPRMFLPQIDDIRYEAEDVAGAIASYQLLDRGFGTEFTGRGYATIPIGQSLLITGVTIPRGQRYCAILRYSLSGNSNAFLSVAILRHGTATSTPTCQPTQNIRRDVTLLPRATDAVEVVTGRICLEEGVTYSVNITATSGNQALIDSFLLVPALEDLPVFASNSSGLREFTQQGCSSDCRYSLPQTNAISSGCRTLLMSALAEFYGQAAGKWNVTY